MRMNNYSTDYSASIVYCPSRHEGDETGWYWEVRVNGMLMYDPIYLEKSRIMAEAMVLKYMAEAIGIKEELAEL